ncbi:MAG: hypothetical protein SF162_01310 [bacterium]|nr:hypothetical protein [bacterium]
MKHLRFLLVLVLLVTVAIPVFAQDFGLSGEDSALLNEAVNNSTAADSLRYEFTAVVTASGVDSSDLNLNVSGSGVISSDALSMIVDGTIEASGETIPAALEVRFVNETFYLGLAGQWFSATPDELTNLGSAVGGQAGLPIDPSALAGGDMSGMAGMEGMGDLMTSLAELDPATFISQSRLADAGGDAVFQTAFDVEMLFSTPAFGQLFAMGMAQGSASAGGEMTPEQAEMMAQMIGVMFADAEFTFDQFVNVETRTVSSAVLSLNLPLEGLVGQPGAGLTVELTVDLSGYNEPVSVEVPADAQPLSQAMGAMMGSM